MATAAEMESKIKLLDWAGLRTLWTAIRSGDTGDWSKGRALEYLVLRAFELDNHEETAVRYPYEVTLFGERVEQIDGAVHLAGLSCLVESKDWGDEVPVGPIAKMRNQLLRRPGGTIGIIFAKAGFSESAVVLAHFTMPQAILLWPGVELEIASKEENICSVLRLKHRACVERGVPDYNPCEGVIS